MVRPRRLELPLRLKNSDLNAARLPIPPRPHRSKCDAYSDAPLAWKVVLRAPYTKILLDGLAII